MKAIMVMFDSLNRSMLEPYGGWICTPNFHRLANRALTFDRSYVGSMPCMPARRELHTGRYNFLHCAWGPLEPFDDSMPELLKNNGVHTHLISDHYHYWEAGGATYHPRYSTWEAVRGQEGDPWRARVNRPRPPEHLGVWNDQDQINRGYQRKETDWPQSKTFQGGLDFLQDNWQEDKWFLQIETFDPHEPYCVPEAYREKYADGYEGLPFDWPPYRRVEEGPEAVAHVQGLYAALVTMCDAQLGKVLDFMDAHELWKDTMLIVSTDHGFLLGEHDCWAKCVHPLYEEVSHTPLFIWDPRCGSSGERRQALVQTIDLAPTLLEFFGVPLPKDMLGRPLRKTLAKDLPVRETALFGMNGGQMGITDGRYVLLLGSNGKTPVYNYTLMPCHMRQAYGIGELEQAELAGPFAFTKGCRVLKIPYQEGMRPPANEDIQKTLLYDLEADPGQQNPLRNGAVEGRLKAAASAILWENDAPTEVYQRLNL